MVSELDIKFHELSIKHFSFILKTRPPPPVTHYHNFLDPTSTFVKNSTDFTLLPSSVKHYNHSRAGSRDQSVVYWNLTSLSVCCHLIWPSCSLTNISYQKTICQLDFQNFYIFVTLNFQT